MKSILIVADEPGWCFESHALQIKKRILEYSIDIAYHRQNVLELSKRYDLIYVMDPMPLPHGYPPFHKVILGLRNEFLYKECSGGPKQLYENGVVGRCVSLNRCSILHMVNRHQMEVFKNIVKQKLFLAQHGIDEEIFVREKYPKVKHEKLVVSVSGRGSENKGFHLVQEACKKTDCVLVAAQYGRGQVSKDLMPKYYSSVDVHVCMSKTEGLNNTIMEAGAMGVPVISTKSGAAVEMIVDGVSGFLIDRSVDALCIALNKMKDEKIRQDMGNKFYEEIMKNWTWKVRIEDFRKMFGKFF